MKNSILLLSCIFESTVSIHMHIDFKRLRNASHIYAYTHPKPKIYGKGRNVHLRHFPWPKRPWPKCPGQNVLGRNVRGRNVRAPNSQYINTHVHLKQANNCWTAKKQTYEYMLTSSSITIVEQPITKHTYKQFSLVNLLAGEH